MNAYSINQVQHTEAVQYYSVGAEDISPANMNPTQLSLGWFSHSRSFLFLFSN